MTDRFPLIINSEDQQIQELSSGDNLDLTGSGIVSDVFTVDTNSQERLRIDSSGRLGIGTTEPSSNIGSTPVLDISGTYGGLALSSSVPSANKVEIGNFGYNTMVFATDSVERMRIDSSGKVGINQSSPTAFIHAKSGANDGTVIGTFEGATNNKLDIKFNSTGPALNVTAGDPLVFEIGGTERMRIDSASNVRVKGASANDATLKIESTATAAERSAIEFFNGSISRGRVSGSNDFDGLTLDSSTTESAAFIRFRTGGASLTERMRIDSAGRLGVGYFSPPAALSVHATGTDSTTGFFKSGVSSVYLQLGNSANDQGYLGYESSDMTFYTSASERMRIDSSGNMGLGNLNPAAGASGGSNRILNIASGISGGVSHITFGDANAVGKIESVNGNGTIAINATTAVTIGTSGSSTERMRITSDGKIRIGMENYAAAPSESNGGTQIKNESTGHFITAATVTTGSNHHLFFNPNGLVGSIKTTGSATSFNESSDYRLKENVVDITDGITRIKQLQPRRFNFIADADTTVDGFLAHEAQVVVPEAVTGTKDEVDDEGNAVMQGIDKSKLVPLLTAALQEAIAKIETLETEVAALKAS